MEAPPWNQNTLKLSGIFKSSHVSLGLLGDADEGLASVRHLHDGDSSAVPVEELCLGLLQHGLGEDARSSGEVPCLLNREN